MRQEKESISGLKEEEIAQELLNFHLKNSARKNCHSKLMEKIFENLQISFSFSNQSLFFQPFCVLNFLMYESSDEAFYESFQKNKKKTEALILQNCFGGKVNVRKVFKEQVSSIVCS